MKRRYYGRGKNRYSVTNKGTSRYVTKNHSSNDYYGLGDFLLGTYICYAMIYAIPIGIAYLLLKTLFNSILFLFPLLFIYIWFLIKRIDINHYLCNTEGISNSFFGKINGLLSANLQKKKFAIIITIFSLMYIMFLYRKIISLFFENNKATLIDYYIHIEDFKIYNKINVDLIIAFITFVILSVVFAFLIYLFALCVIIIFNQLLNILSIKADLLLFFAKKKVAAIITILFILLVAILNIIILVIMFKSDPWNIIQNINDYFFTVLMLRM